MQSECSDLGFYDTGGRGCTPTAGEWWWEEENRLIYLSPHRTALKVIPSHGVRKVPGVWGGASVLGAQCAMGSLETFFGVSKITHFTGWAEAFIASSNSNKYFLHDM